MTAPAKRRKRHNPDSGDKFQQLRAFEAWRNTVSKAEAFAFIVLWNVQPGDCSPFWISHSTIGRRIGSARETAVNLTKGLCERGLVVKVARGHTGGKANTYRIPVPLPDPPAVDAPVPSDEVPSLEA